MKTDPVQNISLLDDTPKKLKKSVQIVKDEKESKEKRIVLKVLSEKQVKTFYDRFSKTATGQIKKELLPFFSSSYKDQSSMQLPSQSLEMDLGHHGIPIGIDKNPCLWVNAWLQFSFSIPWFRTLYKKLPKAFDELKFFLKQYEVDQRNKLKRISISSEIVMTVFWDYFPSFFLKSFNFNKLISFFLNTVLVNSASRLKTKKFFENKLLLLEMDHLNKNSLKEIIHHNLCRKNVWPEDLFISFTNVDSYVCGEIPFEIAFFDHEKGQKVQYFLNAFISKKIQKKQSNQFIAFVKAEGVWHFCSDTQIVPFNKHYLDIPLSSGVIFHYSL